MPAHSLPRLLLLLVALALVAPGCRRQKTDSDEFLRLSNIGKAQLERNDSAQAAASFQKALALNPAHPDAKLNLANALLLAERNDEALKLALSVLEQDRNNPAAYYVAGLVYNRQRQFPEAIRYLSQAKQIDITVNPVSVQLGLAYEGTGNYDAAIEQYEEVERFAPDFPGIHFRLAQAYQRKDRPADAARQMQLHQAWLAKNPGFALNSVALERSKYTEARVPFTLEQPDPTGVQVRFVDATAAAFDRTYQGPVGVIDYARNGHNHLLVRDGNSFRLLVNEGGRFRTNAQAWPFTNGGNYSRWLVADLNKDSVADALVLGDRGVHLYRFTTNGTATETTTFAGLKNVAVRDGIFADLSFRSDLDLVAVNTNGEVRVMRNLQNMYFVEATTNVPSLGQVRGFAYDDWNDDEVQDLFVARENGSPALLLHQRGGGFSNAAPAMPAGQAIAVGDLNNDLRPDLAVAGSAGIEVAFGGDENLRATITSTFKARELRLLDYDNDGWLDIIGLGTGVRVWRNAGAKGFVEASAATQLLGIQGAVHSFAAADLDRDGDTDFVVAGADGVRYLRNEGGNANHQLTVQLLGTRSNPSALGTRIEVHSGGLRLARRVTSLPVEIGVAKHQKVDAVAVHWIELTTTHEEAAASGGGTDLFLVEPMINTGSCPFLYAWDGERFRFVTDILGSAPLGLPIAPGRYIEADSEEMVWLGREETFKTRQGHYVIQLTEELREALYLDEVKLVVVDHEPGTEVFTTDRMIPARPPSGYPRGEIITLHQEKPLRHAVTHEGRDATATLVRADGHHVSPRLREPQYRGLAEPHSITLDFGPLDESKPLVLALTGWLRFGGGTANIAASSRPDFPFPFAVLEAELPGEGWKRLDVGPAAPSGKTKSIVFDLTGKLPKGAMRLRISAAFEIHWDRIALLEKVLQPTTRVARLKPTRTHLHWRGYSELADLPWTHPATPIYEKLMPAAPWRVTPSGWATRYGAVDELVAELDNALAIIAGGDEFTAEFTEAGLPAKPPGFVRDFFLFTSGWDKDSDYHVVTGTTVEPMPWHGMNDQLYGKQPRPALSNDWWMATYNTRWVGARILGKKR